MSINTIVELFAKSPLKPLQEHSNKVYDCCCLLPSFFEETFQENWPAADQLYRKMASQEKQASALKREIRLKLPRGLFLPVDRRDTLDLVSHQDRLANRAKDIAGRVLGRQLVIPISIQPAFKAYVQRCLDAAQQANRVINEIDELLEHGFRGREALLVERMIMQLDAIEDNTDTLQIDLRRSLMPLEAHYNPIDVVFLYQIVEWVGGLADQALSIGIRLEIMLARA